jgi:hypothetical protein
VDSRIRAVDGVRRRESPNQTASGYGVRIGCVKGRVGTNEEYWGWILMGNSTHHRDLSTNRAARRNSPVTDPPLPTRPYTHKPNRWPGDGTGVCLRAGSKPKRSRGANWSGKR